MKEFYRKNKRTLLMLTLVAFVIFLSACARTEAIGPESEGLWDGIIIYNFSRFILWLSELFGGSYGLAIIVFTALGQILLLPLTNYQQKSMAKTQEIQPELEALREKYSAKDEETKEKLAEETQKLQSEAGVNPLMGCLPMLIQMPIFIALYQTVTRTPELATGNFLWLELGEPDPYFILPILAALFTMANSWLMQYGNPTKNSSSSMMTYIMPIMIFFITFRVSSSLALYFAASNATRALISLIFQNPFKKRRELMEKEEEKLEQERKRKRAINKAMKTGRSVKK